MKSISTIAAALLFSGFAHAADNYPSKPIRLIVPYPAGASSNDILGRDIAQRLTKRLGQQGGCRQPLRCQRHARLRDRRQVAARRLHAAGRCCRAAVGGPQRVSETGI